MKSSQIFCRQFALPAICIACILDRMQMIADTQRHSGRFKQITIFHRIMRPSYSKRLTNHLVSTTCIYFDTWVISQEVLHENYAGWSETPETSRSPGSKYAQVETSRPFQTLKSHVFHYTHLPGIFKRRIQQAQNKTRMNVHVMPRDFVFRTP